jgi:hypothetical protein
MRSIKGFIIVIINLTVGMVLGIFRKGDFFDKQTNHLSKSEYIVFLSTLMFVMIVATVFLYRLFI